MIHHGIISTIMTAVVAIALSVVSAMWVGGHLETNLGLYGVILASIFAPLLAKLAMNGRDGGRAALVLWAAAVPFSFVVNAEFWAARLDRQSFELGIAFLSGFIAPVAMTSILVNAGGGDAEAAWSLSTKRLQIDSCLFVGMFASLALLDSWRRIIAVAVCAFALWLSRRWYAWSEFRTLTPVDPADSLWGIAEQCDWEGVDLFYSSGVSTCHCQTISLSGRRPAIVLKRDFISTLPRGERAAALWHELGHIRLQHTRLLKILSPASLLPALIAVGLLSALGERGATVLLAGLILLLSAQPAMAGLRLRLEIKADAFAASRAGLENVRALLQRLHDEGQNETLGGRNSLARRLAALEGAGPV
jgi:Zn-dependent protease with chaperone function